MESGSIRIIRRNRIAERPGAERAVELLLAKLAGEARSEVAGGFDRVPPPAPVPDLSRALLALVTEAGCVPQGNPDRLPSIRAQGWLRYPVGEVDGLAADRYESVPGGFDVTLANEDPNRLVPLDTVRSLERAGRIGRVHDVADVDRGARAGSPPAGCGRTLRATARAYCPGGRAASSP